MSTKRYIIITLDDAKVIAQYMRQFQPAPYEVTHKRILDRFDQETGADIEEIVGLLKGMETCAACNIEGQAASCCALEAQKLGRRLKRLLDRARPDVFDSDDVRLLREAGWLPIDREKIPEDLQSAAYDGDWTPPEDRLNFWDFGRAVAEQKKRNAKGGTR